MFNDEKCSLNTIVRLLMKCVSYSTVVLAEIDHENLPDLL